MNTSMSYLHIILMAATVPAVVSLRYTYHLVGISTTATQSIVGLKNNKKAYFWIGTLWFKFNHEY